MEIRNDSGLEKNDFFSIVVYGIHSKYKKELERKFETEFNRRSVFFYEGFLEKPYIRKSNARENEIYVNSPYLLSILNEQRFIPKIDKSISDGRDVLFQPFTFHHLWEFCRFEGRGIRFSLSDTYILKEIFKVWKEESEVPINKENFWIEYDKNQNIVKGNFKFNIGWLQKEYLSEISKWKSFVGALKEYLIIVYPWLLCPQIKKINVASISISTNNIFYGHILIIYPPLPEESNIFKDKYGKETKFAGELTKVVKEVYIPVLLFFENCWEEIELEKELKKTPEWSKYILLNESLQNSEDKLEKAFYLLWKERRDFFKNYSPRDEAKERISNSLLFAKYMIGSPSMAEITKNIVVPRERSQKFTEKDYIPCVLVSGSPGSGKDTLAQIVQLFFPEYRFGKRYTINMAALKPNFLSVPLMSGFEGDITSSVQLGERKRELNVETQIKGIFLKIWDEHKKRNRDDNKARVKGVMPVIILDELNSLDIDAQGSLLRILQNAKLQPLGSPGELEEKVDFLIIATVNEPEDVLTLEKPLYKFLTEKELFGGVVGKALYEYFRNMRRLRDDLYYRLIRDGHISIPNLKDRREDIPLLFSYFVKKDLTNILGVEISWGNLWFDVNVFEVLTDKSYSWSGNFRQLESIAKRTVINVINDKGNIAVIEKLKKDEKVSIDKPIQVLYKHIEDVIKLIS